MTNVPNTDHFQSAEGYWKITTVNYDGYRGLWEIHAEEDGEIDHVFRSSDVGLSWISASGFVPGHVLSDLLGRATVWYRMWVL